MRFIIAIVLFVVAFVGIGLGIAERTVFAEADRVTESVALDSTAPVTVIDGSALNAFDGRQTLAILGGVEAGPAPAPSAGPSGSPSADPSPSPITETAAATESDAIAAVYGTTTDVLGWVGESSYTLVTWDAEEQELVTEEVVGSETAVPTPIGSDLWFGEFEGSGELGLTVNVPRDVSLLMVSDGTLPAPQEFSITWPLEVDSPLATPLTIAGFAALLLGLLALIWALVHMRRQRGPRRKSPKGPKMPRVPKPSRYRPVKSSTLIGRPKGRRAVRRIALLPGALATALLLSACGIGDGLSISQPTEAATASSTAEPEEELPPVAVTARQAERIIDRLAATVAEADEAANGDLAASRLVGPALALRQANYAARANSADVAALPAIPTGSVDLVLPQQTDVWPRQVFAIVSDPEDETVPPLAIVLTQATARDQYRASHLITLEPQATLPEVPPASLGTAFLGADTPFLPVQPATVVQSYAEVLLLGEAGAPNFALFQAEGDSLRTQIGFEKKEERRAAIPSTASIDFTNGVGDADIITMSTLDAGALVVGYLTETETVTPTQSGATVNASGTVAALANIESSERGITATYGVQVLFYVPSLENPDDPVVLLGYTQGLVAASEVQ
ncbi:hypothetical protein [Yonghaparkia sp. Root332]|uniref:hypothetical protein n=1 Tax=Yonghaparkia sp. Root332 TaxID=1736516 RepID=UPI0006FA67BE|nr:hypothetical protein [Yonghaparkia sp. Root332]KQV26527.1 hypothetical protein ASC54_06565 [Yonghaparkia sp. Root332]